MTALVAMETILLVLLSVLVTGLLRSHAEILRRLEAPRPGSAGEAEDPGLLPAAREVQTAAFDVAGTTVQGDPLKIAVRGTGSDTLLAFLSSGCLPCRTFWEGIGLAAASRLPGGARLVVVTKDPAYESGSKLRELASPDVPVVMSSEAWEAYGVLGSPYFIHVDGRTDRVRGEGTATTWSQVISLLRDAFADTEASLGRSGRDSTPERLVRADRELRAAGIGPGHPSLYGMPASPADSAESILSNGHRVANDG